MESYFQLPSMVVLKYYCKGAVQVMCKKAGYLVYSWKYLQIKP